MLRVLHELHLGHARLFQALDRVLRQSEGITTAHQVILLVLEHETSLASSEVARRTGHSKSRLTGLVDTLEQLGMIARAPCPSDGRSTLLSLTDKGRQVVMRTKSGPGEINEQILAPFSDAERETIGRFLRQLREVASRLDTEA